MEMLANKPDSEGKREVFVLEIMIVNVICNKIWRIPKPSYFCDRRDRKDLSHITCCQIERGRSLRARYTINDSGQRFQE